MRFELLEDKGWKIIVEGRETWRKYYKGGNLPLQQYFPSKYVGYEPYAKSNFFYAAYPLDSNEEIALQVNLPFSFARSNLSKNLCRSNLQMIVIAINTAYVSFDTSSVSLVINKNKIGGSAISYKIARIKDMVTYDHGVYDLASAETVANMQLAGVPKRALVPFSTFYFRFPVSCKELENAVFVIDGFTTRDGKRLPPLKVRLNYYDFDMVPEFPRELVSMCK